MHNTFVFNIIDCIILSILGMTGCVNFINVSFCCTVFKHVCYINTIAITLQLCVLSFFLNARFKQTRFALAM